MILAPLLLAALSASAQDFERTLIPFLKSIEPRERMSDGLPRDISPDIIGDGFLDFPAIEGIEPPIADDIAIDGTRVGDGEAAKAFDESHGISLPQGRRIKRLSPGTKEELWDFPVGTRLFHRFEFKGPRQRLYELRLIEKQADGRWSFGIYVPAGPRLALVENNKETLEFDALIDGRAALLRIKRLHPESCRGCHQMHSPNYYPEERATGPCGFGPANPKLLSEWAAAFKARRGYEPFAD